MAGLGKGINKGLGKGFDALIPTGFDESILLDSKDRIQKLSIDDVTPNAEQPRSTFDEHALQELATSIKRYGILQPLIVSPTEDKKYRIVAGERRWRAAQLAGLADVPVIIRDRHELEELEIALIENVQRVDLSPLEQALSIERLHQQFSLDYKTIAKRLGKAETTVSNIVRLLQLPEDARYALRDGAISEGHARAILALRAAPDQQAKLLEHIVERGWSVRQAEQFVTSYKQGVSEKQAADRSAERENDDTRRISAAIKTPVSIKRTARGGRLELHFKSDDELHQLIELLDRLKR
ncbi:hypothetical protein CR970_04215 [Candidatus Saccharibacteria bacterium]|nr:MAG: hypothetical protein CR970_04215 [Candidatus Saccharibacteria bacterium]